VLVGHETEFDWEVEEAEGCWWLGGHGVSLEKEIAIFRPTPQASLYNSPVIAGSYSGIA
jgi:hypothetical protein